MAVAGLQLIARDLGGRRPVPPRPVVHPGGVGQHGPRPTPTKAMAPVTPGRKGHCLALLSPELTEFWEPVGLGRQVGFRPGQGRSGRAVKRRHDLVGSVGVWVGPMTWPIPAANSTPGGGAGVNLSPPLASPDGAVSTRARLFNGLARDRVQRPCSIPAGWWAVGRLPGQHEARRHAPGTRVHLPPDRNRRLEGAVDP